MSHKSEAKKNRCSDSAVNGTANPTHNLGCSKTSLHATAFEFPLRELAKIVITFHKCISRRKNDVSPKSTYVFRVISVAAARFAPSLIAASAVLFCRLYELTHVFHLRSLITRGLLVFGASFTFFNLDETFGYISSIQVLRETNVRRGTWHIVS